MPTLATEPFEAVRCSAGPRSRRLHCTRYNHGDEDGFKETKHEGHWRQRRGLHEVRLKEFRRKMLGTQKCLARKNHFLRNRARRLTVTFLCNVFCCHFWLSADAGVPNVPNVPN